MINHSLLENNLQVVTDTVKTIESVSIHVMMKVGSRYEEKRINGISHLLEHMAFKGTKDRTALQIAEDFDNIGGYFNAYTSREYTVYHAKVLKDKKYVEFVVGALADILMNSVFDDNELTKEKLVVNQEIARTNDTPDDLIFDKHSENAYKDQSFGRSILGLPEVVNSMSREDLIKYTEDHYFSSNTMIVFSGNIEHEDSLKIIRESKYPFLNLKDRNKISTEKARYTGGDYREHRDLEQTHVLLGFPGFAHNDNEYYKILLLSMILGGGMSSRLFQEIREKRGLAYIVSSFHSSYTDVGMFNIYSAVDSKNTKEFCSVSLEEISKIADKGIKKQELERSKRQLKSNILMEAEMSDARASRILSSFVYHGRNIDSSELLSMIEKVNESDIKQCAANLMKNKNKLTFTAIGDTKKMPEYSELIK